MKVSFYTLGCKVNQYETNAIIQKFGASGFQIVPWGEFADIFVINTCTVTNMADRKSRQILRRPKKINPDAIIVGMGCFIQSDKDCQANDLNLDIAVGTDDKEDIVEILNSYLKSKEKSFKFTISNIMDKCEFTELGVTEYTDTNRAFIKIQDGCEQYCTYCIIPYVRGRIRSRKKENIINEVKALVKKDIKEIVLTGIHVASFGKDNKDDYSLIDLIEDLNKVEGLERIRLSSIEPTYFTENILDRMKNIDKLCNHFHLSLQSASNSVLKRMNRKYTVEQYMDIVKKIRESFEDVTLTTDIIVGFPGETQDEFNETVENLKKLNFYSIHVFKYSRRQGTIADKMENQIIDKIKTERSNIILKLSDNSTEEYMKKNIGKEVEVLFEEIKDGYLIGHTTNYIMVNVGVDTIKNNEEDPTKYINTIGRVKLNKYKSLNIYGDIAY